MAQRTTPSKPSLRFNPLAVSATARGSQQGLSVAELQQYLHQVQSLLDAAVKREATDAAAASQVLQPQQPQSVGPQDTSRFPVGVRTELSSIAMRIKETSSQIDDIATSHKALQDNWHSFDDDFKIQAKVTAEKMSSTHRVLVAALKDLKTRQHQIIEDAKASLLTTASPAKGVFATPTSSDPTSLRVMSFLSTGIYTPPPPKPLDSIPPLGNADLVRSSSQVEDDELVSLRASMKSIYPLLAPMQHAATPKPLAPSKVIKREPAPRLPPTGDWNAGAWSDAAPLCLQAPSQHDAQADHSYGRVFADTWNAAASSSHPAVAVSSSRSSAPPVKDKGKGRRASTSPVRRSGRLSGEESGLLKLVTPKRPRKLVDTAVAPPLDSISEQVVNPAQRPLHEGNTGDLLVLPTLGDDGGFEPLASQDVHLADLEGEEAPPSSLDSLEGLSAFSSGSEALALDNEAL